MRGAGLLQAVVTAVGLAAGSCAWAAPDATRPMAHLGLQTQSVQLPGAGQIILVFICVAALAVGVAALLRRYGGRLGLLPGLQQPAGVAVTVLARQRLEPGISLHVVNIAGERLAIVTSRSGVAMHTLSAANTGATPPTSPGDRLE
jgi:hypothetical protein